MPIVGNVIRARFLVDTIAIRYVLLLAVVEYVTGIFLSGPTKKQVIQVFPSAAAQAGNKRMDQIVEKSHTF